MILEEIVAYGHPLISAKHKTTLEITKENFLTKRGDCIIAVNADKSCFDLANTTKKFLKQGKKLKFVLIANNIKDEIVAFGHEKLILKNPTSLVIRKSSFIDDRTIALKADKAAKDIKRELIEELKNTNTKLIVRLIV
ncbi:MAG: DUF371 domain-containing protein [Candidatus Aenigmarchaeota archaeon]|nr:DUF371 domain-containing protein [Candidatus Aenigmarchaeota archaeon]